MQTPEALEQVRRGRAYWYCLLTAVVVAMALSPVVRHEFSGFDDATWLYWNPHLGRPLAQNVGWYWRHPFAHLYVPVAFAAWNVVAVFARVDHGSSAGGGGLNPAAFHAASLALHALNAVLVFVLLRRLVKRDAAACAGALLFGLHP